MLSDFGTAVYVEVQALGQPGQRTFYLRLLGEGNHSAALKLEKQHLLGLRTALAKILEQSGYQGPPPKAPRWPDARSGLHSCSA